MLNRDIDSRLFKIHHYRILFPLLGILTGYLVFHPYTMLVYTLTQTDGMHGTNIQWSQIHQLWEQTLMAFNPKMLPMSISFMFLGGLIGMLLGIIFDRRQKLILLAYEDEKKRVALETLKELVITLSHHLLNSNMIIGGKVRHCRKAVSNNDILASLDVIEEQGRKIDTVIKTLRELRDRKLIGCTTGEQVKMIDIAGEVENNLDRCGEMH